MFQCRGDERREHSMIDKLRLGENWHVDLRHPACSDLGRTCCRSLRDPPPLEKREAGTVLAPFMLLF